jgi:hypothetical protein
METAMPRPKKAPLDPPGEFVFKEPGEDPAYDAWFREQVQIGLDQADRGEVISQEEMARWFAEQRAILERKIAEEKDQ